MTFEKIIVDANGTATFEGENASKFSYVPELRKIIDCLFESAHHCTNRAYVIERDGTVRAGQSLTINALNYMTPERILVMIDIPREVNISPDLSAALSDSESRSMNEIMLDAKHSGVITKGLTSIQKSVLRIMETRRVSAIYVPEMGWTWMQDVRESHKTALAVSRYIKGRQHCVVIPEHSEEFLKASYETYKTEHGH